MSNSYTGGPGTEDGRVQNGHSSRRTSVSEMSLSLENGCSLTDREVRSQEPRVPFHTASHLLQVAQALQEYGFSKNHPEGSRGLLRARRPPSEATVHLHICSRRGRLGRAPTVDVPEQGLP